MSTKLYYQRPILFGSGVTEISSLGSSSDRIGAPFFDTDGGSLVELGHRYYQGEASQGSFLFRNIGPTNDYPLGHCLVTLVEDESGNDRWLSRGRVVSDEGGRGVELHSNRTEWDVIVEDGNVDLRGQAFWEHWTRPEETDIERLVALQLYTLNGSSSTSVLQRDTCQITVNTSHLAPNSNLVTMPAKKYPAGTQPLEVVKDCAENAGKVFGVVIHHSTNPSHLCLLYIDDQDHSTYASGAIISDQLDEWDPDDTSTPVLEPHWEAGAGTLFQMQTITSHLVMTFGPENVSVTEQAGTEDNYDYWAEHYSDGTSTTAAQAIQRAEGMLPGRAQTHVTHKVSVIINPNQVHLFAAGMSLQTKSEVLNVGYTEQYFTRRIAECRFEPREDGRYWVHLNLERPPMLIAPGRGTTGPIPPVQSEPPTGAVTDYLWTFDANNKDTTNTYPVGSIGDWHAGFVHTHVLDPTIETQSPLPPASPGAYQFRAIYDRADTSSYNPGGIRINVYSYNGATFTLIGQTSLYAGYPEYEETIDVTVPGGGTHFFFEMPYNTSNIREVEISHGGTDPGFVGTPVPPASTDSTGAIGTSATYAPADHQHPAQAAGVTPIVDEGGYFTAAYVEGALQELAASGRSWKAPVRVATTAAGTLSTSFENGDTVDGITLATGDRILIKDQAAGAENGIYTVNASGAPTRATDFDGTGEAEGAAVHVRDGTANGDTLWAVTNNGTITIGSTALVFAELSGGGGGTLDDLTDVVITGVADGDTLEYDSGSGDWVNVAAAGGGTLDALSDVVITSPADGYVLTYDSGSGDWIDAAPSGSGQAVPTLLQSTKGSADTPDDEFDTGTLDGQWTVVDGGSGTATLLSGSGAGIYDLTSRDGWILFQVGTAAGDGVELRQDYTLPDGNCIVAYFTFPQDMAVTPANNEVWAGLGVDDNDTLWGGTTAQTAHIVLDTDSSSSVSWRILGMDDTGAGLFGGAVTGPGAIPTAGVFLRIDRDGLNYHLFWSIDGFGWSYLGVKTMGSAANNVWLWVHCEATMANRMVIGVPWIRQGTALAVDPWPL